MTKIIFPEKKLKAAGIWPMPFQAEMVEEMLKTPHKKIYNASEQGTGKTAMSIMYANSIGARSVLVVTTATLRLQWAREYQLWSVFNDMNNVAYVILNGKDVNRLLQMRLRHPGNLPSPVITSYNMIVSNKVLRNYLMERDWDLIICDEFHKARSLDSQTSSVMGGLICNVSRMLALSGTPMCNSAADLLPALFCMAHDCPELLDAQTYRYCTDPKLYLETFVNTIEDKWGTKYSGAKQKELLRGIFVKDPPWVFRKRKDEVLKDLPPITFDRVDLDLSGKTSVDSELAPYLKQFEGDHRKIMKPGSAGAKAMATMRRELGQQLVACNDTYEIIEDAIDADGCVIVGAYHREAIRVLKETLEKRGHRVVIVDGSVSPSARFQYVNDFQEGRADVFIGQLEAAGEGINLSRAQQVIVVELDWLPKTINQFISRPHRIGQKGNVLARFLCTKSEMHRILLNAVIKKQKNIDFIVDGISSTVIKPTDEQKTN